MRIKAATIMADIISAAEKLVFMKKNVFQRVQLCTEIFTEYKECFESVAQVINGSQMDHAIIQLD